MKRCKQRERERETPPSPYLILYISHFQKFESTTKFKLCQNNQWIRVVKTGLKGESERASGHGSMHLNHLDLLLDRRSTVGPIRLQ